MISKGLMQPEDMVIVDLDGNKVRMISIAASPYAASTACGH